MRKFEGHRDEISTIKWDPAGSLLASCSEDQTAMIWSPNKDQPVCEFTEHTGSVSYCAWSPTGVGTNLPNVNLMLATSSYDHTVKLWDVESSKLIKSLAAHQGPVMKVAFSPDFKFLASSGNDGCIALWSMKDHSLVKKFRMGAGNNNIYDVNWSFDS